MATDTLTRDAQKERKREQHRKEYARKKAEVRQLVAQLPPIECACGCGTLIAPLSATGKPRRYAASHGQRRTARPKGGAGDLVKLVGPEFTQTPACYYEEEKEIFFDEQYAGLAKSVCSRCPVREECLKWALEHGETEGVWGGLTAMERATLRKVEGPEEIDLGAVVRAVRVGTDQDLTTAERRAAAQWMDDLGISDADAAERLNVGVRTIDRYRKEREAKAS